MSNEQEQYDDEYEYEEAEGGVLPYTLIEGDEDAIEEAFDAMEEAIDEFQEDVDEFGDELEETWDGISTVYYVNRAAFITLLVCAVAGVGTVAAAVGYFFVPMLV